MVMNKNLRENKHRKLPQVNAFSTSRNQSCYINYIRSLLLYNPLGKKQQNKQFFLEFRTLLYLDVNVYVNRPMR